MTLTGFTVVVKGSTVIAKICTAVERDNKAKQRGKKRKLKFRQSEAIQNIPQNTCYNYNGVLFLFKMRPP